MDSGQEVSPVILSVERTTLVAAEATDREGNAGFELIGSLSAMTDNNDHKSWFSGENGLISSHGSVGHADLMVTELNGHDARHHLDGVAELIEQLRLESEMPAPKFVAIADQTDSPSEDNFRANFFVTNDGESGSAISNFKLGGTLAFVTDYRARGLSWSNRSPTLQGSIELTHRSGLYAGVWSSGLKNAPGDVELDFSAGIRASAGDFNFDFGGIAYVYPDVSGLNYVELNASAAYSLGPAEVKVGVAYSPKQSALGNDDNLYAYGEASVGIPSTPVSLSAHIGHENGPIAGPANRKWDWSLGAELVVDRFTLGVSYTNTDVDRLLDPDRLFSPGVIGSLKFEF